MTFNSLYLDDVVECQGELFQFAYVNGQNILDFAKLYMSSELRWKLDNGMAVFLTMSGLELYEELGFKSKTYILPYDTISDWFGQFLALLQFRTRIDSNKLNTSFPFEEILSRYNVLHDLDLELAVRRVVKAKGVRYYE